MQTKTSQSGGPKALVLLICFLGVASSLVLAAALSAEVPDRAVWTTTDVVDERIATDGQYALIRLCRALDADASSMLSAILDDASLAGIYQVNYEVPALRARALGSNWWELIPKGEDGACVAGFTSGGDQAPMIVYRKDIGPYPEVVDKALKDGWQACREQFNLPQRDPIPCAISSRESPDLSACPEKRKIHAQIANDCARRRDVKAAYARCAPVCEQRSEEDGKTYIPYRSECVKKAPECQGVHEITATCADYADKQVSCP